jgi:membrane-bound metal-dependent hydrolase YbcI (DUF457 family)
MQRGLSRVLGHDHALTGAVAFAAAAPVLHVTGLPAVTGAALTAGAALLPDIDEPGSVIAREGGFLTMGLAWVVHRVSGGHRKGTHSLTGVAVFTAGALLAGAWQATQPGRWQHDVPAGLFLALLIAAGFHALRLGGHYGDAAGLVLAALAVWKGWDLVLLTRWAVPLLGVCAALGMAAHIAGDELTHSGCPVLYPVSRHEFHLLPRGLRFTTGKLAEHWIVSPLLLALLAFLLWRDAGAAIAAHAHTAAGK